MDPVGLGRTPGQREGVCVSVCKHVRVSVCMRCAAVGGGVGAGNRTGGRRLLVRKGRPRENPNEADSSLPSRSPGTVTISKATPASSVS